MKEVEKRRTLNKPNTNNNQTKQRPGKTEKKDGKLNNNGKVPNGKPARAKPEPKSIVSDSNVVTEPGEVFETVAEHCADDVSKSGEESGQEGKEGMDDDDSSELSRESKQNGKEEVSDSLSSREEDEKVEEKVLAEESPESGSDAGKEKTDQFGERNGNERSGENGGEAGLERKIGEMEARIEKLEEELREVAALEISLYSVVPEHGSSAHKVHTPARRLSRVYIHACKYWGQHRRATVARNTVSGLLLVAKSCGNDVPRLTFWLSNAVVLREIICHKFGGPRRSSPKARLAESNGNGKRSVKSKGGFGQLSDDWQETGTFTAALERVESWIFSRVVESVWWQALTPHMQSPSEVMNNNSSVGRLSGPCLGNGNQGNFSIKLWKNAFQDAAQRLCPLRAGGHECGCLPVLARMVMEQCIARLDVAMFNAILRESAHEIPTDPVSDPIVDSKVLPIPAGDLSFGSGAQLKNSIGNWSRWLTDMFGMDADDVAGDDRDHSDEEDHDQNHGENTKSFLLLNALSDLLMLPKDMLMDRSIRKEVCPSISLPLIKRILCNFTPDEFCPDPVPGAVLEALNAESTVEDRMSGDSTKGFPHTVAAVVYNPPSHADVAEKCSVSDKSELARNVSVVQRKGYTSDDELEELESPLMTIVDKSTSNGNEIVSFSGVNERYDLLSEVWSV